MNEKETKALNNIQIMLDRKTTFAGLAEASQILQDVQLLKTFVATATIPEPKEPTE